MSGQAPGSGAAPDDPAEIARRLVAVPSVNPQLSPDGEGESRIAGLVAPWLRDWGYRVEVHEAKPHRPSVLARIGSGRPCTILNGHLDTVGVEGMAIEPFLPEVRDGRIYGRGSCDMKGGVAAILAAARSFAQAVGRSAAVGELVVALTADEEHASIGLRDLLARGLTGDRAIVAEPTSLALAVANKGFCWAEVSVRGRAAHGSRPDLGRDAIRHAGRILAALDEYEAALDEPHPLLGRGSIHAGTIRGGTAPSVYPARCELVLEARLLPGRTPPDVMSRLESVLARAHDAASGMSTVLRAGLFRPGAQIPPDAPLAAELADACRATGHEPRIEGMSAWVESAWFIEAGIPALCFGPGSIDLAHTDEESVPMDEIRLAARTLERLLLGGSA